MLLGILTYQAAVMGKAQGRTKPSFLTRRRQIDVSGLSPFIIASFVIVVCLGATLYPSYRLVVRPYLAAHDMRAANGMFEVKEHFAALALLMLPAYWAAWLKPIGPERAVARRMLTFLLTGMVWWNFLVGNVIHYTTGMFR